MAPRESKTLEFKEKVTNTFLKTVSAYANYGGGRIFFGTKDDGTITGIENPNATYLDIENRINDSLNPVPPYALEIDPAKDLVILTVRDGMDKPYLYKGKAYKRHDSATVEVSRLEYNRLVLDGTNRNFEDLPAISQDLTFRVLEVRLREILNIGTLTRDILKTLGLYSDEGGYSRAAEILADENPCPGIDMVRFGRNIDELMDRETYSGVSALSLYDKALDLFRKYYRYEKIDGASRVPVELVPEKAFREAIANGIVHRTWDVDAAIPVSLFRDRVEIASPGGLPPGLSEDEYLHNSISMLRNPKLANVFFRLGYIEKFGTGIRRIKNAYADTSEKPAFHVYAESIQIVLPVIGAGNDLDTDERKVLDALSDNRILTRTEMEAATGYNKAKLLRIIPRLLEKNVIEKVGTGRGTKYTCV